MDKPVIIFGAGNLTEAAIEIFNSHGIIIYGILDDKKDKIGKEVLTVPILGSMNDDGFLKFIGKKCEAFLATDDSLLRKNLAEMLKTKRKTMPVNAIHNSAVISDFADLHHGIFINMGSVVGAGTEIMNHCLLHSNVTIDHKVKIGNYVQVGSGSVIGSECVVEDDVFIGSGCTIISGVKLGKGSRIGAGSVVVSDVAAKETVFGNPAKKVQR